MTMIQRELRRNPNLRTWLRPNEGIFEGTAAYTLTAELVATKERLDRVQSAIRPEPWLPLPDDIEEALEAARQRVRDGQVGGWQAAQKRTAAANAREAAEQEPRDKATKSPWRPRPSQ